MINKSNRRGVTLIELLFFIAGIGFAYTAALKTYLLISPCLTTVFGPFGKIGSVFFAVPIGILGFFIPWLFMCAIAFIINYFIPSKPAKCENRKCKLINCYSVRIGLAYTDHEMFPLLGIVYYQCHCGHEYVDYGMYLFTKVNDDGTLKPYMRKTKWKGWKKDVRETFEDIHFRIEEPMLERLRNGTQEDIGVLDK